MIKTHFLTGASFALLSLTFPSAAFAEDCTSGPVGLGDPISVLPRCSLDENTTAPITIIGTEGSGTILGIGPSNGLGSVEIIINHSINTEGPPNLDEDGASLSSSLIQTNAARDNNAVTSNIITQNADIGTDNAVDGISIDDNDTWTAYGDIITNNDGIISFFDPTASNPPASLGGDINLEARRTDANGQVINAAPPSTATFNLFGENMTIVGSIKGGDQTTVNIGDAGMAATVYLTGGIQQGTLNIVNGSLIMEDESTLQGLERLTLMDDGFLDLNATSHNVNTFDFDGALELGAQTTLNLGVAYNSIGDGGDFIINVGQIGADPADSLATMTSGRLNLATSNTIDLSKDKIVLQIEIGNAITLPGEGERIVEGIFTTGGTLPITLPDPDAIIDTSLLYDFDLVPATPTATNPQTALDLVVTRNAIEPLTDTAPNFASADILLNTLAGTQNSEIQDIQTVLTNAPTQKAFNSALESTQPMRDNGTFTLANYIDDRARGAITKRLHMLRNRDKIQKAATQLEERSYEDTHTNLHHSDFAETPDDAGYVIPNGTRALALARYHKKHGLNDSPALAALNAHQTSSSHVIRNKTKDLAMKRLRFLRTRSDNLARDNAASLGRQYRITQSRIPNTPPTYKYDDRRISVWSEGFAGHGSQNDRDTIAGYTFSTTGGSIGADFETHSKRTLMGAMLTYANTDMDTDNANTADKTMETYQLGVYGSHIFDSAYFVNAYASMGTNDITTQRYAIGGTDLRAEAQYDGTYISLFGEYGAYWDIRKNAVITPSFGVRYSRMAYEPFQEVGAGGANLLVDQSALHRLELGPSIAASMHHSFENGVSFIPEARLAYRYNVMQNKATLTSELEATIDDEDRSSSATYQGFSTQNHALDVTLGTTIASDKWELLTHYSYQMKEDFRGHMASMKLNYNL